MRVEARFDRALDKVRSRLLATRDDPELVTDERLAFQVEWGERNIRRLKRIRKKILAPWWKKLIGSE